MPHELPPNFHQIKADEAEYFAEKANRESGLQRLRVTKLEQTLKFAEIEIEELRHQIRETLMENLHLADGDECTLKRLKDAINFELEESSENVIGMARR